MTVRKLEQQFKILQHKGSVLTFAKATESRLKRAIKIIGIFDETEYK